MTGCAGDAGDACFSGTFTDARAVVRVPVSNPGGWSNGANNACFSGSESGCDVVETTLPSPITARYVRIKGTARGTPWGYSIIEAAVLVVAPGPPPPPSDRPTCGVHWFTCIGSGSGSGSGSCSGSGVGSGSGFGVTLCGAISNEADAQGVPFYELTHLEFQGRELVGPIEAHVLSAMTKLEVLDLRDNNLYGGFDHTHIPAAPLREILLGGNLLNGPMPRALTFSKVRATLVTLDLGANGWSGDKGQLLRVLRHRRRRHKPHVYISGGKCRRHVPL